VGAAPGPRESTPALSHRGRRRGAAAFALGFVLLGAAVWAVLSQRQAAEHALESARSAPPGLVAAVVLLPLLNWLLTSAVFQVLTGRYGGVRGVEMRALIGSAWLLNYIPARAGLAGRIAYHKGVNGIRVRDALSVIVQSIGCTGAALAGLLGVIATARATAAPTWLMALAMVSIGAGLIIVALVWRGRAPASVWWRWAAASGLRFLDVTVWGVRYLAVFALAGVSVTPLAVGVVTAASQASMLLPVQVGAREWVVGMALGATRSGSLQEGSRALLEAAAPGLAADLINRSAETLVALPVGLWGTWWVLRRVRGVDGTGAPGGRSGHQPGSAPGTIGPCEGREFDR
jgi:hypothetical protein